MQDPDSLPSRKQPIELQPPKGRTRGRVISAKSDWYWLIGSGRLIVDALGSEEVAQEEDHDQVAGLFCLGMAALLDTGNPVTTRAVPIGTIDPARDDGGVYVVPRAMPDCWRSAVENVGVPWSNPLYGPTGNVTLPLSSRRLRPQRTVVMTPGGQATVSEPIEPVENVGPEDQEERFLLLLNDNGGVWTQSNEWLKGIEPDVSLRALDGKREVLTLRPSAQFTRSGQWKIATGTKALALAKARGFTGGHLSDKRCVSVDVEILAVGVNSHLPDHEDRG